MNEPDDDLDERPFRLPDLDHLDVEDEDDLDDDHPAKAFDRERRPGRNRRRRGHRRGSSW